MQNPNTNQSLSYQLWRLNTVWQNTLRKRLSKFELTYAEYVVMSVIVMDIKNIPDIKRRALKQKCVPDLLNLNKKLVSKTIRSLRDKGLIYRVEDMFDTRGFIVFPTAKGKRTFTEASKVVTEFDKMQSKP
jgi:DNA-binding MarR family transcriptional regulator